LSRFEWLTTGWLTLGALMMPILLLRTAPYGRHTTRAAGPTLPSWLGWLIMESPSSLVLAVCFAMAPTFEVPRVILFAVWQLHYVNRAFIYPFRMRGGRRPMPITIAAAALFFTSVNGTLNGWQLAHGDYGAAWLSDPRFLVGVALFLVGFAINQHSDQILFRLRGPGETGYQIPRGGCYRFVSCPNYFGEILEWSGWALATWSLAGLSFAVWTLANLLPRAQAHHTWYRSRFPDYPPERRALIPFIL
jgi:protein-S-isoprenylcysteine O-methyltransferase Ste14